MLLVYFVLCCVVATRGVQISESDQVTEGPGVQTTLQDETSTEQATKVLQEVFIPRPKTATGGYPVQGSFYGWNQQRLLPYPFLDVPFPYPFFRHVDTPFPFLANRPEKYRVTILVPMQNGIHPIQLNPKYRLSHKTELRTALKTTSTPAVKESEVKDIEVTTVADEV